MEGSDLFYDPRLQKKIEAIELLNDWGFRIIDIDRTLYAVTEFYPIGHEGAESAVELVGQNITSWIFNTTQTLGLTDAAKLGLQSQLANIPERRRKFSANVQWKEYCSATAHNV